MQMVVLASGVANMTSSSCALPVAMAGRGSLQSVQNQKPLFLLSGNAKRSALHLSSISSSRPIRFPSSGVANMTSAVASQTGELTSSDQDQTNKKYYFVVANAKFMLDEEEHFQELMGERLRLFEERNMEQDFWLVIEPKFLDKFPSITKRLKRPAVALVSTNGPWITFMKLRLDRVLSECYEANNIDEALASNPTKIEFEKPDKWVAPYTKYKYGWWEPFLPPVSQNSQV